MKKMTFLAGMATGYVLGARAGRARYEQIRSLARKVMASPTFQAATSQVQANAADVMQTAKDRAGETLADKWQEKRPSWLPGGHSQHAGATNGHSGRPAGSSGQMGN